MRATVFTLCLLALSPCAWADGDDEPEQAEGEGAEGASASDEASAEEEDEGAPRWFAVTHAEVYPGTGGWLHQATLLAKNGRIVALGRDVTVPEGAEVLDAGGRRVYPGLVAYDSNGIVGNPPQDASDPFSLELTLGLAAGLTTVGAGSNVAKLTYGTLEGHSLGKHGQVTLDLSNPRARQRLREDLERLRAYQRQRQDYELARDRGEKVEEPNRKWIRGRLAAYQGLLEGRARARVRADTADDLLRVARLARRYSLRITVDGGREAWTVASELGQAGVAVVLAPRDRDRPDERSNRETGWSIENAARLRAAGVQVALISTSRGIGTWGLAGNDLFTLPLEAAYAVRGGLSEEEAIAALTLVPARLLGVDHRVGSLEVGKDCDLIVTSGELLHYETLVEWAVVNGRVAYDRQQDSLLRAVRPRDLQAERDRVLPQLWPRSAGSAPPELPPEER